MPFLTRPYIFWKVPKALKQIEHEIDSMMVNLDSLTSYAYDNANRLQGIQFPDGSRSTYSYDGDGLRRTAFEAGGALTTFIWDGNDYLGQY